MGDVDEKKQCAFIRDDGFRCWLYREAHASQLHEFVAPKAHPAPSHRENVKP